MNWLAPGYKNLSDKLRIEAQRPLDERALGVWEIPLTFLAPKTITQVDCIEEKDGLKNGNRCLLASTFWKIGF